MTTDYLNTKKIREIIRTTNGLPYWMQSLAFRMYWNYRKHGETYFTLSDAFYTIKEWYKCIDTEPDYDMKIDCSDYYGVKGRYYGD